MYLFTKLHFDFNMKHTRWIGSILLICLGLSQAKAQNSTCAQEAFTRVGGIPVWDWSESKSFYGFVSKMAIDADGSPRAYHPQNKGLDDLAYAGSTGNWWALVTDNGEKSGNPIIQGSDDPYPGYYISTTSLNDRRYALDDPKRYVNSEKVPYFVLPPEIIEITGTELGDIAYVYNQRNGKGCFAIFADTGPRNKLGEGSMYLAEQLGIPNNPRSGGQDADVLYLVFPFSGNRQPRSIKEINSIGDALMKKAGAYRFVDECFPKARK